MIQETQRLCVREADCVCVRALVGEQAQWQCGGNAVTVKVLMAPGRLAAKGGRPISEKPNIRGRRQLAMTRLMLWRQILWGRCELHSDVPGLGRLRHLQCRQEPVTVGM